MLLDVLCVPDQYCACAEVSITSVQTQRLWSQLPLGGVTLLSHHIWGELLSPRTSGTLLWSVCRTCRLLTDMALLLYWFNLKETPQT